jgi:CBS domain-containing protein
MEKKRSVTPRPSYRETGMRCRDVMRTRVVVVAASSSVLEAARLMAENGCGVLPVVDAEGRPIGMLTDRDIVVRSSTRALSPADSSVESIMTRGVVSCAPDDNLARAETLMLQHHKKRVLILEEGRIAGILSLTDVAQVEQPLQLARLTRELCARELRLEHP